jgi:hypothetical protein
MPERDLLAEIVEGRELIQRAPTVTLVRLLEVSPPLAYWSTILVFLIRDELHRREWSEVVK